MEWGHSVKTSGLNFLNVRKVIHILSIVMFTAFTLTQVSLVPVVFLFSPHLWCEIYMATALRCKSNAALCLVFIERHVPHVWKPWRGEGILCHACLSVTKKASYINSILDSFINHLLAYCYSGSAWAWSMFQIELGREHVNNNTTGTVTTL